MDKKLTYTLALIDHLASALREIQVAYDKSKEVRKNLEDAMGYLGKVALNIPLVAFSSERDKKTGIMLARALKGFVTASNSEVAAVKRFRLLAKKARKMIKKTEDEDMKQYLEEHAQVLEWLADSLEEYVKEELSKEEPQEEEETN